MPNLSNAELLQWSDTLIELGRMRLIAEQAPPDTVVAVDLTPFALSDEAPVEARATVFEMRENLDMLITDLTWRLHNGYVHKVMADPFPEEKMMYAILLAQKLAETLKPAAS